MTTSEQFSRVPTSPVLVGVVERLWYVADDRIGGREVKLPTTSAQLVINLDTERLTTRPAAPGSATVTAGSVAVSPIAPAAVILDRREQRRTVGIVLRPEALGAVAGVTAESLEVLVDGTQVWGSAVERLHDVAIPARTGPEALDRIERVLAVMLSGRAEPDGACRAAIDLLSGGTSVAETARSLGLSQSTLVRRFRAAVGVRPKRYQRLMRLERVIAASRCETPLDWAAIATYCGYADQAHLAHEFTELTTFTPSQWRNAATADPFHIAADDFRQDVAFDIGSD